MARHAWAVAAVASLERDMARTPWMMLANLVAIPAGMIWHMAVALLIVTVVTGFAFTLWYVAWIHHKECLMEIEFLDKELARPHPA